MSNSMEAVLRIGGYVGVLATLTLLIGYLVGRIASRLGWSERSKLFCAFGISSIWPLLLIGIALYGATNYTPRPGHSGDAPIYVLLGAGRVFPFLFALALPLAYLGIHFAGGCQRS